MSAFDNIDYVAKFSNGKYYKGFSHSDSETDDLKYAYTYRSEWKLMMDNYLLFYAESEGLTYEIVKVRTVYEIVE